ncbi:hypothetical protein C2G38_2064339, partial [Gigaspora rosea]
FGGITPNSSSRDNIFDDIYILDTLILAWKQGSNFHPPTPRVDFTATLLNNGLILYIGGTIGHVASIYMSAIPTYNTNNNSWGAMSATGDVLNSRSCHTAVLSPDGHVIIYGGNIDGTTDQSQVLASLDTTVSPYKWSIKPMIGDNVPPSLAFHSANVIGNFMILAFGVMMANNSFDDLTNVNSKIYLLDTRNYMWTIDTLHHPDLMISSYIIGVIVAVVVFIAIIVIIVAWLKYLKFVIICYYQLDRIKLIYYIINNCHG